MKNLFFTAVDKTSSVGFGKILSSAEPRSLRKLIFQTGLCAAMLWLGVNSTAKAATVSLSYNPSNGFSASGTFGINDALLTQNSFSFGNPNNLNGLNSFNLTVTDTTGTGRLNGANTTSFSLSNLSGWVFNYQGPSSIAANGNLITSASTLDLNFFMSVSGFNAQGLQITGVNFSTVRLSSNSTGLLTNFTVAYPLSVSSSSSTTGVPLDFQPTYGLLLLGASYGAQTLLKRIRKNPN